MCIKRFDNFFSDVCEVLAWGSAQIHCQCSVNESRVRLPVSSPKQVEEREVTNAGKAVHHHKRECR